MSFVVSKDHRGVYGADVTRGGPLESRAGHTRKTAWHVTGGRDHSAPLPEHRVGQGGRGSITSRQRCNQLCLHRGTSTEMRLGELHSWCTHCGAGRLACPEGMWQLCVPNQCLALCISHLAFLSCTLYNKTNPNYHAFSSSVSHMF